MGVPVKLERKVYQVLAYMVQHRERLVPREELLEHVWPGVYVAEVAVTRCIAALRKAVGDDRERQQVIQTLHGQGYRFVAPVTVSDATLPAPAPATSPVLAPASRSITTPVESDAAAAVVTPLPAPPGSRVAGERKLVTVLYCTLALPEGDPSAHDPESRYTLLQAFVDLVTPAIRRYGGTLQSVGPEGLVALFGVPQALEDHAQRAVQVALEVQSCLPALAPPRGLTLHVGLHTGVAVVGHLGDATEALYVGGEVVAVATRLGHEAPAGAIVVSEATARLVRSLVQLEMLRSPQPGLAVPLAHYQVQGLRPQRLPSRWGAGRPLTPLAGRTHELAVLHQAYEQAVAGQGQVVGLVGEPGMGKSRLLAEVRRDLQDQPVTVLTGHSLSYGRAIPYLPVLDILRQYCGLTETEAPVVVEAHVTQCLQEVDLDPASWAPALLALLGVVEAPVEMTPQALKRLTFAALQELLLRGSSRQPVVLAVEDLHWLDPTSEAWLTALVERLRGAALLLLTTARPGYQPPWLHQPSVTQLALAPLRPVESQQMVQTLLAAAATEATLGPVLVAKAGGNPLFLEELAWAAAAHEGALTHWAVPETIQAVLAARLDQLPALEKRLLQVAAVIGPELPVELLQVVTGLPDDALQTHLEALRAARCLYETRLVPATIYTFAHGLLRDVVYQSLLRSTRQQFHAHIAQVLVTRFPELAETQPALLAHHYTEAGLSPQAIPFWQRAGQQALQGSANLEAIQHLSTGLRLLATLPETPARAQQELEVQLTLGPALMAARGWAVPEVEQTYARARALCAQLGETPQRFPALLGLSRFYLTRGPLPAARELGEQLYRLAQLQGTLTNRLEAHAALGDTLFFLGEFAAAQTHLEQGIALTDPTAERAEALRHGVAPGVRCLVVAANTLWCLGAPAQAVRRSQEALTLAQALAHPQSLAMARHFVAFLHYHRREAMAVQAQAEALLTLATAQGLPLWVGHGTCWRGWALAVQGQGEAGMAQLRQGLAAVLATGQTLTQPVHLVLLAEAVGYAGQVEAGLPLLAEALTAFEASGRADLLAEAYRLQGALLLQQAVPDPARAEACFQQALAIARRQQAKAWELRAATSLSRLWQQQGKHTEGHALLAPVYRWFTEGFDTADLQEAKTLLEALTERKTQPTLPAV
jgi:predicted ATPase/DNA-binding winged helix-turn-helix (wHTH) protein